MGKRKFEDFYQNSGFSEVIGGLPARPHGRYIKNICLISLMVIIIATGSLFLDCPSQAHQFFDFDQSTGITIMNTGVNIEYRIWFGTPLIPGLGMDINRDKKLTEPELFSFLNKTNKSIHANLSVTMNNKARPLSFVSGSISTSGQYPSMAVDIALWYKVSVSHNSQKNWTLLLKDNNFKDYGPERKLVYINTDSTANDIQVYRQNNTHIFRYKFGGKNFDLKPGGGNLKKDIMSNGHFSPFAKIFDFSDKFKQKRKPYFPRRAMAVSSERNTPVQSNEQSRLTAFFHSDSLGPGMLLLAFCTAFFLGAVHALSPGHGKAMVAAYLVGSQGRKRDAVVLGSIVTFTHVISVIILGIIILLLSNKILPEQIYPWISISSGVLIFMVGLFLLVRQPVGHSHNHSHGHDNHIIHNHNHENNYEMHSHDNHDHGHIHNHLDDDSDGISKTPGFGSLISLGVAGGMVPCPSAIVVLLVSVTLNKIFLGLAIILVFSLGLASVLIGIGIVIVSVSGVSSKIEGLAPVLRILPRISACLILILGIFVTFHAMVAAGLIYVNL